MTSFDMSDSFSISDYRDKSSVGYYADNEEQATNDLLRVMRIEERSQMFCFKEHDANGLTVASMRSNGEGRKLLASIIISRPDQKKRSALSMFDSMYGAYFYVDEIGIRPTSKKSIDIFCEYKYGSEFQGSTEERQNLLSLAFDFLKRIVCNNDDESYDYLINLLGYIAQYPGTPSHIAVLVEGLPGSGKSTFIEFVANLFDNYTYRANSLDEFVGTFNTNLENKIAVVVDDESGELTKRQVHHLYSLVTSSVISINPKGSQLHEVRATQNYFIAANDPLKIIPAGDHRFFVLEPSAKEREGKSYFGELKSKMNSGGYIAFMDYLLELNLEDFYPTNDLADTDAKRNLCRLTASDVQRFIANHLLEFRKGYRCMDAWDTYSSELGIKNNKVGGRGNEEFAGEIRQYCERVIETDERNKKTSRYKLLPDMENLLGPLIESANEAKV